ncbi:aggregation-promoting factor [Streptococcus dentapri]|uniref:LysM peptidoglycan-binding domain-containing protein n=1 Tax=Streptococcus dentapri TaxID=573564 RepID=A0ABV8D2F2_9STRE
MSTKSILKNKLNSKKLAFAGLSAVAAFGATAAAHAETYTIKSGDTLSEIAASYNTTVESLVKLNNITNPDFILSGQTLEIDGIATQEQAQPAPQAEAPSANSETTEVPVEEVSDASTVSEAPVPEATEYAEATSEIPAEVTAPITSEAPQEVVEAPVEVVEEQAAPEITNEVTESPVEETDQTVTSETGEEQSVADANTVVAEDTATSEATSETPAPEAQTTSEAPAQDTTAETVPAASGYSSNLSADDSAAKEAIAQKESGGSYTAENGQYYGRYQLTRDYLNNDLSEENQERVADEYVNGRYGSWSAALAYWEANGWY